MKKWYVVEYTVGNKNGSVVEHAIDIEVPQPRPPLWQPMDVVRRMHPGAKVWMSRCEAMSDGWGE